MEVKDFGDGDWIFYHVDGHPTFDESKVGKWSCFPGDLDVTDELSFSREICSKAVAQGIVQEAKCRHISKGGACFFYLACDDMESHKRVIQFFLDNALIPRTKTGRLHNISFKLNMQTYTGQYGNKYKPTIKLDEFLNLDTGEWMV